MAKTKPPKLRLLELPVKPAPQPNRELRGERLAQLLAALTITDLPDSEYAFLATCQRLYQTNRGCSTPFQDFVVTLITTARFFMLDGELPDPDHLADDIAEFRQNWESMRDEAVAFINTYPEHARAAGLIR